ncbi:MAG: hypothetical protein ACK4LA_04005 [Aquificaceae bacterium]
MRTTNEEELKGFYEMKGLECIISLSGAVQSKEYLYTYKKERKDA